VGKYCGGEKILSPRGFNIAGASAAVDPTAPTPLVRHDDGLALSGKNIGQVVHTHVPLSPSSIIWYRLRGGDALRLER